MIVKPLNHYYGVAPSLLTPRTVCFRFNDELTVSGYNKRSYYYLFHQIVSPFLALIPRGITCTRFTVFLCTLSWRALDLGILCARYGYVHRFSGFLVHVSQLFNYSTIQLLTQHDISPRQGWNKITYIQAVIKTTMGLLSFALTFNTRL